MRVLSVQEAEPRRILITVLIYRHCSKKSPVNDLNPDQLAAVQHGLGDDAPDTRPLLVIAGAGSGKTNTLAHRVAALIGHGADPQRIMLLTFSRRASQEMERRVGSVLQKSLGLPATQTLPSLPW